MRTFRNSIKLKFDGILDQPERLWFGGLEHDQERDFRRNYMLVTELDNFEHLKMNFY